MIKLVISNMVKHLSNLPNKIYQDQWLIIDKWQIVYLSLMIMIVSGKNGLFNSLYL